MRIAFDTNVIAYAEGFDDAARNTLVASLIEGLDAHEFALPVEVSAELIRLVTKRFKRSAEEAATILQRWQAGCQAQPASDEETLAAALELVLRHDFQIFDAIILAGSAEAGCQILLSEDMHDGFVWRGVTIVNPFATPHHPVLADALRG